MRRQNQESSVVLKLLGFLALSIGLVCVQPSSSSASTSICKQHFRAKRYQRAAECFRHLARPLENKPRLTDADRSLLFQYFRNAALAWKRAAETTSNPSLSAYLWEKAYFQIRQLLQKRYYEYNEQRDLIRNFGLQLRAKIGYAQVVVNAGHISAVVSITGGYRFAPQQKRGAVVSLELRPGRYILVATRKNHQPQTLSFKVQRGQGPFAFTIRWQNPKPTPPHAPKLTTKKPPDLTLRPSVRTAGWTLFGVSLLSLTVGGILVGQAIEQNQTNNQRAQELYDARLNDGKLNGQPVGGEQTQNLSQAYQNGQTMYVTGWIIGGLGVALGLTSASLFLWGPRQSKPSATTQQPPRPPEVRSQTNAFSMHTEGL